LRLSRANRREPARLHAPSATRKFGRILFDQQMWCWGRDIVRPEGNALLEYGFRMRRPPEGLRAISAYDLDPAPRHRVRLWGFGLLWTDEGAGSLLLERRRFSPRLVPESEAFEEVWRAEQVPVALRPRSGREHALAGGLLTEALSWISGYKRWARRTLGADYRELCVTTWHKRPVPAPGMARCWERLARSLQAEVGLEERG